jgi:hypothetical protein
VGFYLFLLTRMLVQEPIHAELKSTDIIKIRPADSMRSIIRLFRNSEGTRNSLLTGNKKVFRSTEKMFRNSEGTRNSFVIRKTKKLFRYSEGTRNCFATRTQETVS